MNDYRYVGKNLPNEMAYAKVTGRAIYTSDMDSGNMLHLRCKGSEVTHGCILSIDATEAEKVPGVRKIYTVFNTPDKLYDRGRVSHAEEPYSPNQERLFDRHIRFFGERVAAVAAETLEAAERACRLIRVEYEEYPKLVSMESALEESAVPLHEGGNVYPARDEAFVDERGDYEALKTDHTIRTETHIGRMTHLSMETSCARACYDAGKKRMTLWTGTQTAYGVRSTVADFLEMPYSKVRVIKALMGGSFGCKQEMVVEPLTAYVAKDLEADVKWVYTREEQFTNCMQKHNYDAQVESKVTGDGIIEGFCVKMKMDAGAYQTISPSYLRTIGGKLAKSYRMQNIRFEGQTVCTTTPATGSFRSWGSCEAAMLLEPNINAMAAELGMDPIDLRLKNIHEPYDKEIMHGVTIGNARFRDVLVRGRERFGWDRRKAQCREKNRKQGRYRYGVGMALTSHTSSFYPYLSEVATASVHIQDDGSVVALLPVHDHGCGTVLAMKKIIGEILQTDLERIEVRETDTEVMGYDYGCYASRTTYVHGLAVKRCCEELLAICKECAALKFGCLPGVVQYEFGEFFPEDHPEKRMNMQELWEYAMFSLSRDLIHTVTNVAGVNPGTPAAHFTQVKVDTFNGDVEIEHCLSVHDIGFAINPDLCRGQVGSGIQQGIGMALCEEIKIHPESGRMLVTNYKNYEVANAVQMPDYDVLFIEDEEPSGPYGAKGIGEVVLAPIAPAILEAVNQALGTRLNRIPLTAAAVMEACEKYL